MTDFDPTDDDLVSAYLDDEVTTEEAAAVEARPELLARVEELRSLQESLRSPIPSRPTGSAMDDMIGAALGEFQSSEEADVRRFPTERTSAVAATAPALAAPIADQGAGIETPSKQTGVADLQAARERKNRRGVWLLSAAAAVLLAVAIPTALSNLGGDDTDATTGSSADMALETASSESAGDASDAAGAIEDESATAAKSGGTSSEDGDSAMNVAEADAQDAAAMSDSAASGAAPAATTTDAARSAEDEDEDAAMEDSAMEDSESVDDLGFFAITPTLDDLLVLIDEPGFLDELEVVSQEFGAPIIECAGQDESGGLVNLTADEQVVEIILSPPDPDSGVAMVEIIERETCAVIATVER